MHLYFRKSTFVLSWAALALLCLLESRQVITNAATSSENRDMFARYKQRFQDLLVLQGNAGKGKVGLKTINTVDDVDIESESIN